MSLSTLADSGFAFILKRNKNELLKIEAFKNKPITSKIRNLLFMGMIAGTLCLFSLFFLQIISGVFAALTTIIFGISAFFGIRLLRTLDPLIQQKTKNLLLKEMMKEARQNATAQLDNQILVNKSRLDVAKKGRDKMGALIKNLEGRVIPNKFKKNSSYERKNKILMTVKTAYEQVCEQLEKGAKVNNKFKDKVQEYKEMHSFSQLAGEAMEVFESTGSNELENMLSLAAFENIESEFNVALVTIENQTIDIKDNPYL